MAARVTESRIWGEFSASPGVTNDRGDDFESGTTGAEFTQSLSASGIHADDPAIARWEQGLRIICAHANGTQIATDLPAEMGGSGDRVTPSWLMRAGLASCLATSIAAGAAAEGIILTRLEVSATSTSDARGLFGMKNELGEPVTAGPRELCLEVRIGASGVPRERLQAIIDESYRCSPVSAALVSCVPIALRIQVDPS